MMDGERIRAAHSAPGIVTLAFTNPPRGTMDDATERELLQVLDRIDAQPELRVVVLTGADAGVFIRHYDVGVLEERARAIAARGLKFDPARPVPESPIHVAQRRIEASPNVFIAAINGVAMGGGYEIALACDLRIAEDGDYPIGLPEVNIGLLPGAGGTQRLTRLIGEARALELMLQGRTVGPREAAGLGLVNECCQGPVLARAMAIAERIAAQPPRAIAHVKRLVRGAADRPLAQGLADERTLFCDLMVSDEAIERMRAMNAGRLRIESGE
jgi:enoyl-CoA hydratase